MDMNVLDIKVVPVDTSSVNLFSVAVILHPESHSVYFHLAYMEKFLVVMYGRLSGRLKPEDPGKIVLVGGVGSFNPAFVFSYKIQLCV